MMLISSLLEQMSAWREWAKNKGWGNPKDQFTKNLDCHDGYMDGVNACMNLVRKESS